MALRFTFRQLEYLVAIGEAGSIVQASERVNVSPPSISAAVTQLEQEFGVQFFVRRHSHGLSLTAGGRRFFLAAQKLLQEAEGLRDIAADIAERVRGPFGIGCLLTFAQFVLPELRKAFETAHPEVRIHQCETHQGALLDMLLRGEIDVALTYDLDISPELNFAPLASLPPYAMLPAGHRLAGRGSVTPEDLLDDPLVLLDLPLSREYFLSIFRKRGLRPRIGERTGDMAVMRSMVANGFGYALANIKTRADLSPDGKPLVCVPLDGDVRPMKMGLASPARARQTGVLRAFEAHCREMVSDAGIPGLAPLAG